MAAPFLGGIAAHELTDAAADAAAFRGFAHLARELDGLAEHARIERLEAQLLKLLPEAEKRVDPYVKAIAAHIATARGGVRVSALSDRAGISRQHLARRFQAAVGLSPKELARVLRFRALLDALAPGAKPDWAALALDLGYYDQAHLIGEFRAFAGESPAAFQISKTAAAAPR
jgi:AraC-like DNA-binding protein